MALMPAICCFDSEGSGLEDSTKACAFILAYSLIVRLYFGEEIFWLSRSPAKDYGAGKLPRVYG